MGARLHRGHRMVQGALSAPRPPVGSRATSGRRHTGPSRTVAAIEEERMRRLRILVVGSLAVASVTAWAGTAHAARGSDFCDQANDLVGDLGGFDPLGSGNSDELDDQIDATVDAYQE